MAPMADHPMREFHETWLYFHLVQAANARRSLDRAPSWTEYEDARRAREHSIARASDHYRKLIAIVGASIDPLLARMALTEGLVP